MTVPTNSLMFDIVQIARAELEGGKIAIHCHAGFGRTGLVVACILMLVEKFGCKEAIDLVRQKRKGSIQTKQQEQFIYSFHDAVRSVRNDFAIDKFSSSAKVDGNIMSSIGQTITNQQYFLTKEDLDSKLYRHRNKLMTALLQAALDYFSTLSVQHIICAVLNIFDATNLSGLYEVISCNKSLKEHSIDTALQLAKKFFLQLISCKEGNSSAIEGHKKFFIDSISSLQEDDNVGFLSIVHEPKNENTNIKLRVIFDLISGWFDARCDSLFGDCDVHSLKEILKDFPYHADRETCKNEVLKELQSKLSRYKLQLLADLIIVISVMIYRITRHKDNDNQMEEQVLAMDIRRMLVEVILLRVGWLCCHHNEKNMNDKTEHGPDWLDVSNSIPLHHSNSLCLAWQYEFLESSGASEEVNSSGEDGQNSLSIIIDILRILIGGINVNSDEKSSELVRAFKDGESLSYVFPIYDSKSPLSSPALSIKSNNRIMWSPEKQKSNVGDRINDLHNDVLG